MSDSAQKAAEDLIEILQQENSALARFDLASATALVAGKQTAIAGLESASHTLGNLSREIVDNLQQLTEENRKSLERAMTVQAQIISIIADACAPPDQRYGQTGRPTRPAGAGMALSVRA